MTAAVVSLSSEPRYELLRVASPQDDFAGDVRAGLTATRKSIPPRWFYDALGSSLFDAICFLPEYYVTRAETEVLAAHREEIAKAFGAPARIVELGSGAARKTRVLFDALTHSFEYVPVDIDAAMLDRTARDLLSEYPSLRVTGICSDFARPSRALASLPRRRGRTIVLFLGSTIGNLERDEAAAMLRDLRISLDRGDALFLGADLRKPREVLEPAYDDGLGVTAAFNLNLLQRINRELGGHFALDAFAHRAFYDEARGRIEMHLVSKRAQRVRIDALHLEVAFADGESIHTENSYKYDEASLRALAGDSGFALSRIWTDSQRWFADALLVAG